MPPAEKCPVCDAPGPEHFLDGSIDPAYLTPDDFRITDRRYGSRWPFSRCRACGFIFADPRPSAQQIVAFYNQLEDPAYGQEAAGRARNFSPILKRVRRYHPRARRLLDIGAASGIFLDAAARSGYEGVGIEPSASLVAEAKSRYGIELFCGTLEDYPATPPFDVVTLLDLIEHVVDPVAFMTLVSSRVAPGGLLVIVTPDGASLAARLAGKRWWHYRTAHVHFFSLPALTTLLDRHGFDVIAKRRYAWNFTLHYLATRLWPSLDRFSALQKVLKRINWRLQLFDSWEIYARKRST